jgi:hypothetical protein
MAVAVQECIDWVEDYVAQFPEGAVVVRAERRVKIGKALGVTDEECTGTSDITIEHLDGSLCVVIDYKHGRGVKVYAKDNEQLLLYAIGARADRGKKFKRYMLVIVQPRANKRHTVDTWEQTDGAINKFILLRAAPAATAALLPNAPRAAGEHCRWCRASPACYAYRAKIRAIAEVEFDAVETVDEEGHKVDPLDRLTVDQYAEILREAQTIENWLHAVRGHALRMVQSGTEIPGFALGWTQRRRIWDEDEKPKLLKYLKRKSFLPEQYSPRELLSPSQMLTMLKKAGVVLPKKRGSKELPPNPLDAFTVLSMPNPKLVPTDAETEFDDLEE